MTDLEYGIRWDDCPRETYPCGTSRAAAERALAEDRKVGGILMARSRGDWAPADPDADIDEPPAAGGRTIDLVELADELREVARRATAQAAESGTSDPEDPDVYRGFRNQVMEISVALQRTVTETANIAAWNRLDHGQPDREV